jgi:hypothetical protein
MKHHVSVAVVALLAVAPIFAQVPKGWMYRVDRSTRASDPDAPGNIKLIATSSGFHAISPQASIFWNPANKAAGAYSLKGTFTLLETMGHSEYYGLLFGGSDLEGPGQNYLYFMIAPDGTWLVKRRTGDASTEEVSEKTPSNAVKQPDASGKCTNTLEVRVRPDKLEFVVNGTVVDTLPKTGQTAKTDGIYGIRVNHHLQVQVDGFGISKQ